EFTVVPNSIRENYGPIIAYDSNSHQFAVLFNYEIGQYSSDYHMGIALIDPNSQSVVDLQESLLGGYELGDFDMIYDESVGRYLIVWTNRFDYKVYGMYAQWNLNEFDVFDFVAEPSHRVLGEGAGYQIRAAYNPNRAQTAIMMDYFDTQTFATGLTVTSVTYGQTSPQWVPIPQSLDLMEYYDIAYDYQNNQYAVVWQ